jgi:hypothetical protein
MCGVYVRKDIFVWTIMSFDYCALAAEQIINIADIEKFMLQ